MSDKREDLSVSEYENNHSLNININELQNLWSEFLEKANDKVEGEFTRQEAATAWNVSVDTAYGRLERMVVSGVLEKRKGLQCGKITIFYKKPL